MAEVDWEKMIERTLHVADQCIKYTFRMMEMRGTPLTPETEHMMRRTFMDVLNSGLHCVIIPTKVEADQKAWRDFLFRQKGDVMEVYSETGHVTEEGMEVIRGILDQKDVRVRFVPFKMEDEKR